MILENIFLEKSTGINNLKIEKNSKTGTSIKVFTTITINAKNPFIKIICIKNNELNPIILLF